MKIINLILLMTFAFANGLAQTTPNDLGGISLNVVLPENNTIPAEANQLLETRLKQIVTRNGIADDGLSERFVITARTSVIQKDVAPTAPPRISQRLEVTFMIGDVVENKIYETASLTLSGIGTNETQAFISAFQNIRADNRNLAEMIQNAKEKITQYYNTNCDKYLQRAKILETDQQFDEAIYTLMQVPNVSEVCYNEAQNLAAEILDKKIKFHVAADEKLQADEQRERDFRMQQYDDAKAREQRDFEFMAKQHDDAAQLSRQRIEANRQAAIEFARNQPKEINPIKIVSLW